VVITYRALAGFSCFRHSHCSARGSGAYRAAIYTSETSQHALRLELAIPTHLSQSTVLLFSAAVLYVESSIVEAEPQEIKVWDTIDQRVRGS
jgi:hypothetical protein